MCKVREVMVDEESLDALFQVELNEIEDCESMEDLFSKAFDKMEESNKSLDCMQHAGVSLLTPLCRE